MKIAFLLLTVFSLNVFAAEKGHNSHHSHKALSAHEHGHVVMAMAIEGKNIDIDLSGPSEAFLGFEHAPKSKEDQLTFKRAKDLWTIEILSKLVMFDSGLKCTVTSANFEQTTEEGTHSEVKAEAVIACQKDLKGSDVKIGLKDKFPGIKKCKMEIIGASTKTLDIKKAIENVRL